MCRWRHWDEVVQILISAAEKQLTMENFEAFADSRHQRLRYQLQIVTDNPPKMSQKMKMELLEMFQWILGLMFFDRQT